MDISVQVAAQFARRVRVSHLRRVALKTLRAEKAGAGRGVSIVVVDDRTIRALNRRFHHINAPTDVLAFPAEEEDYLGDIVISYETARVNARAARWRLYDELSLLVTHGLLHVLGYDDTTPRKRARMWRRQAEILHLLRS